MNQYSAQPDAVLIDRVRAGEKDCFAELVRRYQAPLARVARSRLGRADWAEDVVQDTFLAAFKSCATYNPRYAFRTWLWTILLNQCYSHAQRRARSVPCQELTSECEATREGDGQESKDSPLRQLLAKERTAQLDSLLRQLTAAQADALRLRFFGGLKFQEIAEAMDCSLNTAKNRVRCGLLRLAELLQASTSTYSDDGNLCRGNDGNLSRGNDGNLSRGNDGDMHQER